MNQGIKTILYPVKDLASARSLFRELLGAVPHVDEPYYVGFKVGDQEIGLVPNGANEGMTAFYHVDDIRKSLKSLVDAGAMIIQDIREVGGGRQVAIVKDENGNIIGLIQDQMP